MLRRLSTLLLSLALTATSLSPAAAQSFATAPGAPVRPPTDRDLPIVDDVPRPHDHELRRPAPRINARTRARLRAVLARHRSKNIAAFRAYARRGVYPRNYITNDSLNIWIDGDGRMCAAATMIFRSGKKALVRQVARDNNFIRLADVTDGPLLDWILTSGLTHAEVIAIQAPTVGGPRGNWRMTPEAPAPQDWRVTEAARLRAHYDEVLADLSHDRADSLESAIDALTLRPDLIAHLLGA